LEAIAPGGQESHSSEAQGKSQENTADKNDDDHDVISLPLGKIPQRWGLMVLEINLWLPSNPKNSLN